MTNYARGHGWQYMSVLLAVALAALMLVSSAAAADDSVKFKGFGGTFPPVANFTANTSTVEPVGVVLTGVAPFTVNFWDLSNESITARQWEFGLDASLTTSTLKNPVVTFPKEGTYTVTLRVTNATGFRDIVSGASPVITTDGYKATTIVVTEAPFAADFEVAPAPFPAGYDLQFTDTSSGNPTTWLWNFGDGTTSNVADPTHKYTAAGDYVVSLSVTGALGTATTTESIDVTEPVIPVAAFTTNFTAPAFAPLAVKFTDASTNLPTEWAWEFGDGKTSTEQSPVHVYTAAGSYLVNLTATNAKGDHQVKNTTAIEVLGTTTPDAAFTANGIASAVSSPGPDVTGNAPFKVTFVDTSVVDSTTSPATSWLWTFGDGTTSTAQNPPAKTYSTPGTYNVQFTATNSAGVKSAFARIVVGATQVPVADFTFNKSASANNGLKWDDFDIIAGGDKVWFNSTSTNGPTSTSWIFSDGRTFSTEDVLVPFPTAGNFWVLLSVSNSMGSSQKLNQFTVIPRVADLAPVAGFDMIQQDDTAGVSAPANLDVVIPAVGKPVTVNFTNTSTGGKPTSFQWFEDSTQFATTENATLPFDTPGTYPITLIVSNPDGTSSQSANVIVSLPTAAPHATFTVDPASPQVAPATVEFTYVQDLMSPAAEWLWNFGDGTTSTDQNPTHQYDTAGTYTIRLTAKNSAGSTTSTGLDYVINPLTAPGAVFNANTYVNGVSGTVRSSNSGYVQLLGAIRGSAPLTVNFTDVSIPASTAWSWNFGDGTTAATKDVQHVFTAPGRYNIQLLVTNAAGTTAIFKESWVVVSEGAPISDFTATPTSGPAPLTVKFTDMSQNVPTAWAWVFGDGQTSTEQNPEHVFTEAKTYTVSLTTYNSVGTGTTKTATITADPLQPPVANFTWAPTPVIAGEPITFTDTSENTPATWQWFFPTRQDLVQSPVPYTFAAAGDYAVTLLVSNDAGFDTETKIITVVAPTVTATPTPTVTATPTPTVTVTPTPTVTVTPTPTVTAIGGNQPYPSAHTLPGRVEAEDYDVTAGYPAYFDTTAANEGGAYRTDGVDIEVGGSSGNYNVGWIRAGEFLTYSVDVPTGEGNQYQIIFRMANPSGTKSFQVYVDGQSVGTVTVPVTGSFSTWTNVEGPTFQMTQGRHVIKVDFVTTTSINFDYMSIEMTEGPTPVTTTPTITVTTTTTTQPSGSANFVAVPTTAKKGAAVKFTVTPTAGKTIQSVWWSFDADNHLNTWNSRATSPTFFYPATGTFSPLVKITYTDNSVEEIKKSMYVKITA